VEWLLSELILVRHGQASFGAESYDKLSPTGARQVAMLANHWQGLERRFDVLYSGELRRQQETAELLKPVVESSTVNVLAGLNEYNGEPLIRMYLRDHALSEGFDLAPGEHLQDRKMFQLVLEAASRHWIEGSLIAGCDDGDFEPWREFQARVHAALNDIMARHTGGSKVVAATSGGVIAVALQLALQLPDNHTIATNWMVNNSSVTRLVYGRGKVSLGSFNTLSHLETPELRELITFR
jgi:broad specificity phosphatase PhoE